MLKTWLVMTVVLFVGIGVHLPVWIEKLIFIAWVFLGARVIYHQMKEDSQ